MKLNDAKIHLAPLGIIQLKGMLLIDWIVNDRGGYKILMAFDIV